MSSEPKFKLGQIVKIKASAQLEKGEDRYYVVGFVTPCIMKYPAVTSLTGTTPEHSEQQGFT
jgi:hypothetical protein